MMTMTTIISNLSTKMTTKTVRNTTIRNTTIASKIITNLTITSTLISELELLVDRAKNGDRLDSALLPGTDTSKDFAKHKVLGRIYTYLD